MCWRWWGGSGEGHSERSYLTPQIHGFPAPSQALGAGLQVALKRRLAAVPTACHIIERRREVKRPQVRVDPKYFHAAAIEEHDRRGVRDAELARPRLSSRGAAGRGGGGGRSCGRAARPIECADERAHLGALQSFAMELVAGRAMRGLEEHRERLGAWLTPQVVRRSEEERLVVQFRTRRLPPPLRGIVAGTRAALPNAL